jgi:membrane fusion protein (multidrug efflux system)
MPFESLPVAPPTRRHLSRRQVSGPSAGPALLLLALSAALGACGGKGDAKGGPPPPVEVGIVTLERQTVRLTTELPGRTQAYETSEVRPQVSGIIRARLFTEGQKVEKGQTLYQIDARLYRAAAAQARANLASARAASEAARARAERYTALVREQVVSEQDYADAKASAQQATAAIQQAQAALDTALINLRFTEVPAPISGRIGRSLVTTGALVTSGQADALATIQRLDPIFVDMQESSANLLAMRRALAHGGAPPASADVRLMLEDGSEYAETGTLEFAEATVEPSTGSVTLRAKFENPDGLLLPGMYVRAIVAQGEQEGAILAPQPGVTRDPKGNAMALLVGPGEKVEARPLELERTLEDRWLVSKGLSAGDRLIVEGTDKVKPGQVVKAVPANGPERARTGDISPATPAEAASANAPGQR